MVILLVKMINLLVLCPVLFAVAAQTLTIDSQLGTSIEDCFERVSIGEQLPNRAIYRNETELTTRECEKLCKQDKQCQSFDYGVGAKGNATCELSNISEKEIKENKVLQRHPDYDVYVRRFQCEQSPPTPLQAQFDEPGPGPTHRPVFRPEDDEKRPDFHQPQSDEIYQRPQGPYRPRPTYNDQKPSSQYYNYYDTPYKRPNRPQYVPNNHIDDRPDDYSNQRPELDSNLGYGTHKPQDIPYKPVKPYRPHYNESKPKPDPYDVLQFQDQYNNHIRPQRPLHDSGYLRPDPNYPPSPADDVQDIYGKPRPPKPSIYNEENPQYEYFVRPNRKPYGPQIQRPQNNPEYDEKPSKPYQTVRPDLGYGTHHDIDHSEGPIGPPNYRPSRPTRPLYGSYEYASNYGQSNYNHDNHVYVEIYDPPNYYKPNKPHHTGYGQHTQSDHGHASIYGQNYHRPHLDEYDRPNLYKPTKPNDVYDSQNYYSSGQQYSQSYGYNSQSSSVGSYQNYQKPQEPYRPGHGSKPPYDSSNQDYNSGSQQGSGYNRPSHDRPSYVNNEKPTYGVKPHNDRPTYSYDSTSSYNNKPNHDYHFTSSYDSKPGYDNNPTYEVVPLNDNRPGYGSSKPPYDSTPSYNNKPSHSNKPNFDATPSYGNKPSSDDNTQYYGSKPSYNDKPVYSNRPTYNDKPFYDDTPSYGNKPTHSNKPGYDNTPSYGNKPYNDKPSFDDTPSYGNKPSYDDTSSYGNKPTYSNKPSYDNTPSYGNKPYNDKPSYDDTPSYGNKPSYNNKPSYVDTGYGINYNNKPNYDDGPGYNNKPSSPYGNKPTYDDISSYNKPANTYNDDSNQGYGGSHGTYDSSINNYGSSSPGYGGDDYKNNKKPNKPNSSEHGYVKPVYEYEFHKPSGVPSYILRPDGQVISSHPVSISDYNDGRPASSRDPDQHVYYKLCFRRVLAGRRTLRSHVRRVVDCERLEDCRRECALERRFHCESFNYRLDPSFRSKGLCELMTKPIEAFDLRRDFVDDKDYDFYELDRNSLEPNCPTTLRGPGLLHSGYLGSKDWRPGHREQWRDRQDDWNYNDRNINRGSYDRFDNRRYHGRTRYEEENFVPYQIGIGRSNDEQDSWGQYGGSYGGNDYYKNRNDYKTSLNHWRLNDDKYDRPDHFYGVKPYDPSADFNYHSLANKNVGKGWHYGHGHYSRKGWNESGGQWNGLSIGESSYYGSKKHGNRYFYEDDNESVGKDCSSRRRPGMSLGSGAIRRSIFAPTVLECESACFNEREFKCVSYSYRYSNSKGSDNCFLSERPYRGLDLASDSGSDVYAMPVDQPCSISQKPWIESECFWHVRSGAAISGNVVKAALTVAGLGACEAECIRARGFFCRGFSFRFDSPTIGDDLENCLLTSSPPTSLEPHRGLRPSTGHELYSRGNYGRGCEPALYDEVTHRERQCYLKYDNAARLIGSAVRGQARVRDEQACGAACTDAPFRCLSFSFNNKAPRSSDNCLLSDIRLFDLQRGVDYEHSTDDWLFAFDVFNGQCWRKPVSSGKDDDQTPIGPSSPSGPGYGSPSLPSAPYPPSISSAPYSPSIPSAPYSPSIPSAPYSPSIPSAPYSPSIPSAPYSPSIPSGPYSPSLPSSYPASNPGSYLPKPDPPPVFIPSSRPGYLQGSGPELPSEPPGSFRPSGPTGSGYGDQRPVKGIDETEGGIAVSWRHYTVSGLPCRQGTSCAQNLVAGHWSCEPEGGEVGSWDYCCSPNHRCGYSEGFHKPWCYVGSSIEQWRPCSEKYYPYHQHNVPHPSQGHREQVSRPRPQYIPSTGWSQAHFKPGQDSYLPIEEDRRKPGFVGAPYLPEADRKYWDDLYNNGPSAYYDKYGNPLPGYVRVPTESRPHIKYHHNYGPRPSSGHWQPISGLDSEESLDPPIPGGLGVPRYWPVAYLHKGPPPNMTYFKFNETNIDRSDKMPMTTSTARYQDNPPPPRERSTERPNDIDHNNKINHRDEKTRNITNVDKDVYNKEKETTTTAKVDIISTEKGSLVKENISAIDLKDTEKAPSEKGKGIDGKLEFTDPIEVLDIEDAKTKGEKQSELKTLEAEERQIEAIGRLLANRRGGKLVLEKRSQKDLETKNIAIDKELVDDFNFGAKFPITNIERRATIQRVSKDDIQANKNTNNDKSLEVSETTYVRPPRILSTTASNIDTIRKAYVNGKIFYDASVRDQRDLFDDHSDRKQKALSFLKASDDAKLNPLTQSFGKKRIKARNVNPVRRVRRVYKKRYNPEEVRKRLLERERSIKDNA